jgi:hypothetical protein
LAAGPAAVWLAQAAIADDASTAPRAAQSARWTEWLWRAVMKLP